MSHSAHWACPVEQHLRYRKGEHSVLLHCPIATDHNPSVAPRDCYTCKQADRWAQRGRTAPTQQADKLHFACSLMPWEHDPPNLVGSMGGHRDGCAVLPGHTATPGKQCPQCRRRYAGIDGFSPNEIIDHPHYDCSIPILDHEIRPRVGRGHRPGCQVAKGHDPRGISPCKICSIARDGENYIRDRSIKSKYGLTSADYDVLLEKQDGACAICRKKPNRGFLHVDHNHATGMVRGLLCKSCNLMLGYARDDAALLLSARDYLATR